MPIRQGRASSPSSKSRIGFLFVAAAILALIVGFLTVGMKQSAAYVEVDDLTFCPTEFPVASVLSILIDVSDTLSAIQKATLKNELELSVRSVGKHGLVQVFALESIANGEFEPVLEMCNPGSGDDMNRLYQNPGLANDRWERDFVGRFDTLLELQVDSKGALTSPLYAALQAVAVTSFGKAEHIVASDLLQHGGEPQSHYLGVPSGKSLFSTPAMERFRADLRGVDIEVLYIKRVDNDVQGREHLRFWQDYFSLQGGSLVRVLQVYG